MSACPPVPWRSGFLRSWGRETRRSSRLGLIGALALLSLAACASEEGGERDAARGGSSGLADRDAGRQAGVRDGGVEVEGGSGRPDGGASSTTDGGASGGPQDGGAAGPGRDAGDAGRQADAGRGDAGPAVDAGGAGANPEPGRLAGITAAHNGVRARVMASPALAPLSWSPEVAAVAQAYAAKLAASCGGPLVHSSSEERMGFGENLASRSAQGAGVTRAPGTAEDIVGLWESERACYTYGPFRSGVYAGCTAACEQYGGCGHYTQLVWRATARLGCGFAECQDGARFVSYWVCNYDPAGNILDHTPY